MRAVSTPRGAEYNRSTPAERDVEQAITALKKGATLLKYGRRGKPKFCPFKLSVDEAELVWYLGKDEKALKIASVQQFVAGQRTSVFARYPRPHVANISFSLIYNNGERSLDLVCKDAEEFGIWSTGLKALVTRQHKRGPSQASFFSGESSPNLSNPYFTSSENDLTILSRQTPPASPYSSFKFSDDSFSKHTGGGFNPYFSPPHGAAPLDPATATTVMQAADQRGGILDSAGGSSNYLGHLSVGSSAGSDIGSESDFSGALVGLSMVKPTGGDMPRPSVSSAASHSSREDDNENLQDLYMWGEGLGDGVLGGGALRVGSGGPGAKLDALLPKIMEATVVLDVQTIACGGRHAALVNKQGELFCWGEESGGRLGHGVDSDAQHPQLVEGLAATPIEGVACGEYHTSAVSTSGDLYTWGDGTHGCGLLGHGNEISHWVPKKVEGGLKVAFIACGPWHTACITTAGQLFTWGDGTFGALGHGKRLSTSQPKEVEALKGLRANKVACGVWHTAAVIDHPTADGANSTGRLYSWGDGDKARLGHGNKETKWEPQVVEALVEQNVVAVACGHSITVALTAAGTVYTAGSSIYGQLGNPSADGKKPGLVEGHLKGQFVDQIACGAHHVAALTSLQQMYVWGKGANGRLGLGDVKDRDKPTLVEALKDKQVVSIACGSSFSAAICTHKWANGDDHSKCSGCKQPFGLTRRRHNCYHCGNVFCHACSSKKALNASMSPNPVKPSRVCDACFGKLAKAAEAGSESSAPLRKFGGGKWKGGPLQKVPAGEKGKPGVPPPKMPSVLEEAAVKPRVSGPGRRDFRTGRVSPSPNSFTTIQLSAPPAGPEASPRVGGTKTPPRRPSPSRRDLGQNSVTASPRRGGGGERKADDLMLHEMTRLRQEVDFWRTRCEQLEAQQAILRTEAAQQVAQAVALAGEEAARANASKEVIKSLSAQLRDMAERLPEGAYRFGRIGAVSMRPDEGNPTSSRDKSPLESPASSTPPPPSTPPAASTAPPPQEERPRVFSLSPSTSLARPKLEMSTSAKWEINGGGLKLLGRPPSGPPSPLGDPLREQGGAGTSGGGVTQLGNKARAMVGDGADGGVPNGHSGGKSERDSVIQVESGVYITLTALPGGQGNELRRVRFSRKMFSEGEAERWWSENRPRVLALYNVRTPHDEKAHHTRRRSTSTNFHNQAPPQSTHGNNAPQPSSVAT